MNVMFTYYMYIYMEMRFFNKLINCDQFKFWPGHVIVIRGLCNNCDKVKNSSSQ